MTKVTPSILPSFKKFAAATSSKPVSSPIVFLHGFLGSMKNFSKMAHHCKRTHNADCFTLDARNHGSSPHIESFAYRAQAMDLAQFMNQNRLSKATLIGYSMGAKTAMDYTLLHPERVDRLVCIDNAPVNKSIGPEFRRYITALRNVMHWCQHHQHKHGHKEFKKHIATRLTEEVKGDRLMAVYLSDLIDIRMGSIECKVPLQLIDETSFDELSNFPDVGNAQAPEVETLLIKAGKSHFVDNDAIEQMTKLFPKLDVSIIPEATHADLLVAHYAEVVRLVDQHLNK